MRFYVTAFMGTVPFGSLIAGVLAESIGAPLTVIKCGGARFIAAALFVTRLPAI